MKSVSPTEAKDLALYFLSINEIEMTPVMVGKTIGQAKGLLGKGYSYEQLREAVLFFSTDGKPDGGLRSIYYINYVIDDYINDKIRREEAKKRTEKILNSEVGGEKTNEERLKEFDAQSRLGAKYNFDMFKRPD